MAEPVRTPRRRWVYGIAVAVLLGFGVFVYRAIDPLNSIEQSLVGVWKERTPRREHDVLGFSPERHYFVNGELRGTWRAAKGRLQVTPLSMGDIQASLRVQMPLRLRLYFLVSRVFSNVPSKPAVTAAITAHEPDSITLRPEPGTDETTFDRDVGAGMPEVPRLDDIGMDLDDSLE